MLSEYAKVQNGPRKLGFQLHGAFYPAVHPSSDQAQPERVAPLNRVMVIVIVQGYVLLLFSCL